MDSKVHNWVLVRTYHTSRSRAHRRSISNYDRISKYDRISMNSRPRVPLWKLNYPHATTYLKSSWWKRRRTGASYKAERPQKLCDIGALQDGRFNVLTNLIQQGDWMIKLDLKDVYLQVPIYRVPMFPPIQLGAEDILVCVPPIWVDVSPVGVH